MRPQVSASKTVTMHRTGEDVQPQIADRAVVHVLYSIVSKCLYMLKTFREVNIKMRRQQCIRPAKEHAWYTFPTASWFRPAQYNHEVRGISKSRYKSCAAQRPCRSRQERRSSTHKEEEDRKKQRRRDQSGLSNDALAVRRGQSRTLHRADTALLSPSASAYSASNETSSRRRCRHQPCACGTAAQLPSP